MPATFIATWLPEGQQEFQGFRFAEWEDGPVHWNGWAVPELPFDEAMRYLHAQNEAAKDPEYRLNPGMYDAENDTFVFPYEHPLDKRCEDCEGEDVSCREYFQGEWLPTGMTEGRKLYSIGGMCWTWDIEE